VNDLTAVGCVYVLSLRDDSRPRYVGITTQPPAKRLGQHRTAAQYTRNKAYTWALSRWMRKHGVENVVMTVVESGIPASELFAREREYVAQLRMLLGPALLNQTEGGEGAIGYRHDAVTKARIGALGRGLKRTPETRQRMREAVARRPPISEETRGKLRGRKRSDEAKEKMRAAWSDERREAQAERLRQRFTGTAQDPEVVALRAEKARGTKRSAETLANMRAAWTPEKRSAHSAARKGKLIKLTREQVAAIREASAAGRTRVSVAAEFGVTATTVWRIAAGKGHYANL
jgi:hypothetical protein